MSHSAPSPLLVSRLLRSLIVAIVAVLPFAPASAQEEASDDPLVREVLAAATDFAPITAEEVDAARIAARHALEELDGYLSTNAPTRGEGWRTFLGTTALSEELDGQETPNLLRVARAYNLFIGGDAGLELPPFKRAADGLRTLLERLQLREGGAERQAEARARYVAALDRLDVFLAGADDAKNKGWREYLKWDALKSLAEAEAVDPRAARQALALLEGSDPGLKKPAFRRVARTLAKRIELAQFQRQDPAADRYRKRLEQLAESLRTHLQAPTNDSTAELNAGLLWLNQLQRRGDLVANIQSRFSKPNLFVEISETFVANQLGSDVDRCEPVVRCFEGSTVRACAHTRGCLIASIAPCDEAALICLRFEGLIQSRGVAQKRKVFVSNYGETCITANKALVATPCGIEHRHACADACSHQTICGICVDRNCGRRLIERGAKRKAAESKGRAENFASNDACRTLTGRMDQEAATSLAPANRQLADLRAQLQARGLYPRDVNLNSTEDQVLLRTTSVGAVGLAAPSDPPAAPTVGQVTSRMHQSAINDVLTREMGGIKIDNESIVALLEKYKVPVPEELKKGIKGPAKNEQASEAQSEADPGDVANVEEEAEDESWSMTFDRELPATVTFADNMVRIGVRGRRFARGEQTINERINISAAYRIVREGADVALERDGDVQVEFVNSKGRLSTRQLSYKVFLERKFGAMFQSRFSTKDLPTTGPAKALQALQVDDARTENGWFLSGISAKPGVKLSELRAEADVAIQN